jgi:hypothetical protein
MTLSIVQAGAELACSATDYDVSNTPTRISQDSVEWNESDSTDFRLLSLADGTLTLKRMPLSLYQQC